MARLWGWPFVLSLALSLACSAGKASDGTSRDGGGGGSGSGAPGGSGGIGATGAGGGGSGTDGGGSGPAGTGLSGVAGVGPSSDGGDDRGASRIPYEAEDAFNAGTAAFASGVSGFSGSGYVEAFGTAGARVVFAVNAVSDGATTVEAWVRNAGGAKKLGAYVNGLRVADVVLEATVGSAFAAHDDTFRLRAGLNTIAYLDEGASNARVSFDRIDVVGGAPNAARGALVPFSEYEAEDGHTNGVRVGPDRTYGSVAAEASGRKAITLGAAGQYVEWTSSRAANALVLRYSIPDAPAGGGTTGSLSLYVDGTKQKTLSLSSKYAWVYGGYPYNNDPTQGSPHRYFDETRFLVGELRAGAVVRLQRDAADGPGPVTVDFADLELAPPAYARPAGSLSLADFDATPDDGNDDAGALRAAVAAAKAQGKVLWVPAGTFDLRSRVDVDHVTIVGAGPWWSVFRGADGKGGFNGTGDAVELLDFAIFGDVSYRDDASFDAGLDGAVGKGSLVQNVWFEHTKVGVWLVAPTDGAYIVGCRIHDTFADGINFNGGTARSAAEHVHVRNTGDDAFAIWASRPGTDANRFKFDTARVPMLANGFAIYGGADNGVEDSDAADTVNASAGIAVSTRFSPAPFGGTTSVARTTLTRTGGHEPNWNTNFGGLWIYSDTSLITTPIVVSDVQIVDSTYQGILVSPDKAVAGLQFQHVTVSGAGSYGIEVDATGGSATFDTVVVSGAASGGAQLAPGFTATRTAGNTGW